MSLIKPLAAGGLAAVVAIAAIAVVIATGQSGPMQILPTPTADRTFQFVKMDRSFVGTPLEVDALVPHALFVVGAEESAALTVQAGNMAYMIGQWSNEPGTSLEAIQMKANLGPVLLDRELTEEQIADHNLVLVGSNNSIYKQLADRLEGEGSFLEVVPDALAPGRDVMVLSDLAAARYLANNRLYFKSGAYAGFFAFVKSRVMIENENFAEALFALDDPSAVRGCGKPVILAIGHKEKLPPAMLKVAQKRNKMVFKDLRAALEAEDKESALTIWDSAMATCYGCHQGTQGVERYRKFVPNADEHAFHNLVSSKGSLCTDCHKGVTAIVGYDN